MKILPAMFGGSLALAVALLGGIPAASASTGSVSETEAAAEACWNDVITLQEACAATQEDLAELVYTEYGVEFVDQGLPDELILSSDEKDALSTSQPSASPDTLSPPTAMATFVLGIYYNDAGYTGPSQTMTASLTSAPCAAYGNYVYGNINNLQASDFGHNDNIESFQGYGMCGLKLYADAGYSGSTYGASAGARSLGAMANQASSITVHKVS